MRFLILDDDGMLQRRLRIGLRQLGHEVVQIADVDEFMPWLRQLEEVDVLVLDRMLRRPSGFPVLPGEEVGDRVLRIVREHRPHTRVIILTAREFPASTAPTDSYTRVIIKPLLSAHYLAETAEELA